jgi:hypothetical protein
MSTYFYLKNRDTGVVFIYSDMLAKRSDMVPCDVKGRELDKEVAGPAVAGEPEAVEQSPKAKRARRKE